jgi:hypothetical protein
VNKVKASYKSYPTSKVKLLDIQEKKRKKRGRPKKVISTEKRKVGRPRKSNKVLLPTLRKARKQKEDIITNKVGTNLPFKNILTTQPPLEQGKQKETTSSPLPKSINTLMTKSGIEKYFITSGDKEVRMSIHHGEVKATHNILGWWEQIPTSFLIFMVLDEDGIVKRVTIKDKEDSPKNLVVMDNPTTIRICWQEEPTI